MRLEDGRWTGAGIIRRSLLSFVFLVTFSLQSSAQNSSVQTRGYAKNLAIRSKSILSNETYFLDISRLRLKGLVDVSNKVHSEVWLDTELLAGSFLKTPEFRFSEILARPTFADLSWTVEQGSEAQLRQSLFRAFATLYLGRTELTVGRQRIAWGTGFAWNPTDLLNPFNPAAIELAEKEGVDAIHLAIPFGTLSRVEAAFAPGKDELRSSASLRMSTNWGNYDLAIMGGDFRDDKVLGGDFAGYLGSAGFRGEFAYTWKHQDDNYLRAVLNADYNFRGDIYAFIEFYYNGQGSSDKNNYKLGDLLAGQTFNLAKHYLAISANKSLTPLLVLNVYSLVNLNDGSSLVGPSIVYSISTNLEAAASAYWTRGPERSEYGTLKSSFFGYLQFYF